MYSKFILVNTKINDSEKVPEIAGYFLNETNRLEQKIWFCYGRIPLYNENLQLIVEQLEKNGLPVPELILDQREFKRLLNRLINKNKAFLSGLLCITLISNQFKTNLIVKVQVSNKKNFPLKDKGLLLDYSDHKKLSSNEGNRYHSFNKSIWQYSKKKATDLRTDGLIISNEKEAIVDCCESNIYFIKGNSLITLR